MMSTLLELGSQLGPSELFKNPGKMDVPASDRMLPTSL